MVTTEVSQLKESAQKYIIPHFGNYKQLMADPKIFVKGEGSYLYDIEGNKYLDTFASLLTTICGHGREDIADVASQQMRELEFFPNYVDTYTVPLVKLAEKLAEIMPGDLEVSFFVNSGSEANETAIKMAKQYFWEQGQKKKYKVIARRWSYHATTLGGTSATGIPWFRECFEPLMPGFIFAPAATEYVGEEGIDAVTAGKLSLRELERIIQWENPDSIAAMIMDPLPGSNVGYPLPPDGYLQGVRDLCDKYNIVLIFDEIQTGFGKTGKLFACEHWNVIPDIMTIGKGFTGGYLPLGAAVTTQKIYEPFTAAGKELRSGSTYGGHTTACATTLKNIEIILEDNLVEKAADTGAYIKECLDQISEKYSIVDEARGIGMLWAVQLSIDPSLNLGSWIRDYCWKNGMILRNNGDILVIAPALNISKEEVDFMLDLIEKAIQTAMQEFKI